jgi:hypothetical protein
VPARPNPFGRTWSQHVDALVGVTVDIATICEWR